MEVDSHIGAAMSGLIADARTLVDHARVEAQNHRFTYDEPMRVEALTQAVCDLALSFGEVRACLPTCLLAYLLACCRVFFVVVFCFIYMGSLEEGVPRMRRECLGFGLLLVCCVPGTRACACFVSFFLSGLTFEPFLVFRSLLVARDRVVLPRPALVFCGGAGLPTPFGR